MLIRTRAYVQPKHRFAHLSFPLSLSCSRCSFDAWAGFVHSRRRRRRLLMWWHILCPQWFCGCSLLFSTYNKSIRLILYSLVLWHSNALPLNFCADHKNTQKHTHIPTATTAMLCSILNKQTIKQWWYVEAISSISQCVELYWCHYRVDQLNEKLHSDNIAWVSIR